MSDSEENAVIEKIETVWPRLQEVRNDEVELEYGENGGVINGPEYDAAPRIGFFPIYDEGTYPTGRPPYGAVIERKGESTGLEDEKTC